MPKGSAKGGGMPKGMGVPKTDETASPAVEERSIFNIAGKTPNCDRVDYSKTSGGGSGGHLGYNANGQYVEAAACYTVKRFQMAKGAA
jgi:hypothetical protein